jgi:hypothetical protein
MQAIVQLVRQIEWLEEAGRSAACPFFEQFFEWLVGVHMGTYQLGVDDELPISESMIILWYGSRMDKHKTPVSHVSSALLAMARSSCYY